MFVMYISVLAVYVRVLCTAVMQMKAVRRSARRNQIPDCTSSQPCELRFLYLKDTDLLVNNNNNNNSNCTYNDNTFNGINSCDYNL